MIEYVKQMKARGALNQTEIKLLKSGVVFKPIKLAIFGMRTEEITEREYFIKKNGRLHKTNRVNSAKSGKTNMTTETGGLHT